MATNKELADMLEMRLGKDSKILIGKKLVTEIIKNLRESPEPPNPDANLIPKYDGPLYDAKHACKHEVEAQLSGGVRCRKCGGWFCF